ncbi:SDR family NAD(P)-dependent oxidoreductase [Aquabacter sp. L1I39]|uniref:SDR family NAD(P)-dependent oxidoreductase n=1 Tax=Aquabacter sp. L1I39 TaxID=2820278 RepID=UPI001ADC2FF3|nr:SDR family NAD(P)-dependent oxidoreductase [Aquabacter sp. L1I39]QTL02138.1 SDR family NAD(P)-dependent oxidoreductase [Aquabacter sp. L1I39]
MTPAPALRRIRPVLVTGGAGFIGANLAQRLARDGEHVLVLDSLARPGVEANVDWLKAVHATRISFVKADIRDFQTCADAVADATAIFHFAAQVAVTTALNAPLEDFAVNAAGTLGLLEAVRIRAPQTPLVFASTNKVYGALSDLPLTLADGAYAPRDLDIARFGIGEARALDFHTPYGCSKGTADQYVLDYARTFGLKAAVMRMSCIYGPRQMGTEDQGWVAHFLRRIASGEAVTLFGDGHQVRDVLYVEDAVDAYLAARARIDQVTGRAFNLGGGPSNAVTLRHVIAHAEQVLGRQARLELQPWRTGDQRYYVSDTRTVRAALGLPAPLDWREGVARLAQWIGEAGHQPPTDKALIAQPMEA